MPLRGIVHFGEEYPNAFWDGRRMVFGDGDDEIFLRFTKSLDVIGHELGHGVIEDEAGLEYWGQSGALNEHFADVAGIMVKQHKLGQTADRGRLADRRRPARRRVRRRRPALMKAPGHRLRRRRAWARTRSPPTGATTCARSRTTAASTSTRGSPTRPSTCSPPTSAASRGTRPGHIWYDALRSPLLTTTATFRQFARITHRAARQRFGPGSDQAQAVREAWAEVGVRWE